MKLWLLRHPQPDVPTGLCYGATDVPIVDAHLDELLGHLPARLPRHATVYSSPLGRCQRLAQALQPHGFGPVVTDARLREMDFGHWEGRLWTELPREQIEAWRADIARHVPPGGESLAEVATRSLAFVADLPSQHEAIVVTHAGVMQTLLKSLRGLPLSGFSGQKIDYGQVFVLQREEKGWTLLEDAP